MFQSSLSNYLIQISFGSNHGTICDVPSRVAPTAPHKPLAHLRFRQFNKINKALYNGNNHVTAVIRAGPTYLDSKSAWISGSLR